MSNLSRFTGGIMCKIYQAIESEKYCSNVMDMPVEIQVNIMIRLPGITSVKLSSLMESVTTQVKQDLLDKLNMLEQEGKIFLGSEAIY